MGPNDAMAKTVEFTDKQKEDLKKLLADQQQELRYLMARHKEQALALLTPEQKAKWDTEQKVQLATRAFGSMKFTDEQKAKIAELVAAAKLPDEAQLRGRGDREGWEAYRKLQQAIIDEVMTPAQRDSWQTEQKVRTVMGRFGRMGLSEDQKAEIAKLVQTSDLPAPEGGRGREGQEAREAYNKLQKTIVETILTPEQREQIEKQQAEREARERQRTGERSGAREGERKPQPRGEGDRKEKRTPVVVD